ncbi:hypothetical protein Poli38472_001257 [Pythium oligandrum]|uniref:Uncharacterized protein n=1 Tax=Pythium oligandrum TaxID=41045 RepID=A0A8K1CUY2_PYTOL|nr:hypothetical protein Poli38472_001257 [Pythium oligandrum]|eukprot:TMW69101.1 hypothetical protein Poli38472_001257 [Pythium oligandrum]
MGNQRSRLERQEEGPRRRGDSQRVLKKVDARKTVFAWTAELPGCCVRLGVDDDVRSIVKSYEWVEFDFSGGNGDLQELQKRLKAARAASISWSALSCCQGFGGHEDPFFWKLVFNGYGSKSWRDPKVTDTKHFFKFSEFPRYRLVFSDSLPMDNFQSLCRLFFDNREDRRMLSPLRSNLRRLAPFILPERVDRDIQVSIQVPYSNPHEFVPGLTSLLESIEADVAAQTVEASGTGREPHFRVHEVGFDTLKLENDDQVSAIISFLKTAAVEIPHLKCELGSGLSSDIIARFCFAACNVGAFKTRATVQELTLTCASMSDRVICAICSVLPHTRSLRGLGLQFHPLQVVDDTASLDHLWYWLDYALRQPEANESSCRHLRLRYLSATAERLEFLRQIGGMTHQRSVQLREGTEIREQPSITASVLMPIRETGSGEVCEWVMQAKSTPDSWVCIITPGFGRGWVKSEDIIDEKAESEPSTPCLTALSFTRSYNGSVSCEAAVLIELLQRYGQETRYLRVSNVPTTDDQIHSILQATPRLESFRSDHDASFWSAENVRKLELRQPLALRELAIRSTGALPSQEAFDGPLAKLTTLEIWGEPSSPFAIEPPSTPCEELGGILLLNRRIQFLHYLDRSVPRDIEYVTTRAKSRSALGIRDGEDSAMALAPMPLGCRVAFCSVIKELVERGTIADHCDPHVMSRIFEFASVQVPRLVWVETMANRATLAQMESVGPFHARSRHV